MKPAAATQAPASDRWQFLERPAERLRYAAIASLIRSLAGHGRVVEIGGGKGYLLGWLDPVQTSGYVAVDTDARLLSGLRHALIPISRHAVPMEVFAPAPGPIAALVASEVLYYVEEPGHHLVRLWRAAGHIELALVSSVLPRPDKPNWQRGHDRVTHALAGTGWPVLDRIRLESAEDRLAWEIVALRPGPAPAP